MATSHLERKTRPYCRLRVGTGLQVDRDEIGRDIATLQARDDRFADQRRAAKAIERQRQREAIGLGNVPDISNPDRPSRRKAGRAAEYQRHKQSPPYRLRHPNSSAHTVAVRKPTAGQRVALIKAQRRLDRLDRLKPA
jgi:hypothetical protein